MNRLVLIGNGFDLAHGLKTSYADFINWYWAQWERRLMGHSMKFEEDEFCSFRMKDIGLGGWYLVKGYWYSMFEKNIIGKIKQDEELCVFEYKSAFFEKINQNIETKGWVDIEQEYYYQLINAQKKSATYYLTLNNQLDFLRDKLIEYLKIEGEKECNLIDEIKDKIYRPIKENEIAISYGVPHENLTPINVTLLNFNYTSTPIMYLEDNANINYIHGMLKHPQSVIFGYGDELDDNYTKLQKLNDNEYLRNIKSIRYLELDSYRSLLRFIESAPFQVCIMGHSCGNSDRTLLNTLFEHRNCVSVKPYYYIKENGEDNYLELVQNISRNFTDPKLMRDRVVNKEYCEPLVGVKPGVIVMS